MVPGVTEMLCPSVSFSSWKRMPLYVPQPFITPWLLASDVFLHWDAAVSHSPSALPRGESMRLRKYPGSCQTFAYGFRIHQGLLVATAVVTATAWERFLLFPCILYLWMNSDRKNSCSFCLFLFGQYNLCQHHSYLVFFVGIIQQDWFCSGSHNLSPKSSFLLLDTQQSFSTFEPQVLKAPHDWSAQLWNLLFFQGILAPFIWEWYVDAAVCTCSCLMSVLSRWRKRELWGPGFLSCLGSVIVCDPSVLISGIFTFCPVTAHTWVQVMKQHCPSSGVSSHLCGGQAVS